MSRGAAARLRSRYAPGAAAALLAAALAAGPPSSLAALQARLWTPDLRTRVTAGGDVTALAVTRTELFAASQNSVFVYDLVRDAWRPPIEIPAPFASAVSALGADPVSGEIWVGTSTGELSRGMPGFLDWETVALPVRGGIERIVPYPAGGAAYVRSGGEWWRVEAVSSSGFPVTGSEVPPSVRAEAGRGANDPYLAAARNSLGLDADMRRWPITDIARGEAPGEFWIATAGGGIVRFDSRGSGRERLRFGLVAPGAASIALTEDRVWFGGDGRGRQNGVAAATPDLSRWWQYDAISGAPSGFVAEITTDGRQIWFAAEDGLFRLDPNRDGRGAWTRFTTRDGLPSDRVRSVLHHRGTIWAGTDRGLVALDTAGEQLTGTLLPGGRTARLDEHAGSLWIASERGLRVLPLGQPAGASAGPAPGAPRFLTDGIALDVAAGPDTWVLTDVGLFRLDSTGVRGPVNDGVLQRIGPPARLAGSPDGLWVAGPAGVARLDPVTGIWAAFTVPADIPSGPVLDVMPAGDDVWVGTPGGALRLRWR